MLTSTLVQLGAILTSASFASAQYAIEDTYDSSNFFSAFSFFDGTDPTHGFVDYVDATTASNTGLAGYTNGQVYLGVDSTTLNPSAGRASTRVTSNKAYTQGLFIADIAHMPGSICGVWPAFWTFGPNWPGSGEIDILEGVNTQTDNIITLHTSSGCTMSNSGSASTSTLASSNCNLGNGNDGCSQSTTASYGTPFNSGGGGVYAMEWTDSHIAVWFFARGSLPSDIASDSPNPGNWGTPTTLFSGSGCDINEHFANHNIVFDTTFCGDWAGNVWDSNSQCASLASTCTDYVSQNPSAFSDAYWLINSVKVYSGALSSSALSSKRGLNETVAEPENKTAMPFSA